MRSGASSNDRLAVTATNRPGQPDRPLRVAFVWTGEPPATHLSFRFELYTAGMERLGHEAWVVCPPHPELAKPHYRLVVAPSGKAMRNASYWAGLQLDLAIVFTWHRRVPLLHALKVAGVPVVAIADTDGQMGLRTYPWRTLQEMLVYREGWRSRLGCVKYWLGRYLTDGLRGGTEDREFVESTRLSDAVVFTTLPGVAAFAHFLRRRGGAGLCPRLRAVPYAVPDACIQDAVVAERRDRVVAAARWSDPQKNPELLEATLDRFLERRPQTEVCLYGAGGERFSRLAARRATLSVCGVRPLEELVAVVRQSRSVLFASRWESGPHAAMEALAVGTTVVGTNIPSLLGFTEDGAWGTVSPPRAAALSGALLEEMAHWDRGERDPYAIAAHWRPRLAPEAVCSKLLAAVASSSNPETGLGDTVSDP